MSAEATTSQALAEAHQAGMEQERRLWLPLADKLRELFRARQVAGGGAVFSLQDVLDLSAPLERAERRN